jgi:hypothetical protein
LPQRWNESLKRSQSNKASLSTKEAHRFGGDKELKNSIRKERHTKIMSITTNGVLEFKPMEVVERQNLQHLKATTTAKEQSPRSSQVIGTPNLHQTSS